MKGWRRSAAAEAAAAAALAVAGAVLKVAWRSPVPMTQDAVQFVLGLSDFSPERMQPHFPYYPLLLAAGRAVSMLVPPADALSLVSAASGALVPVVYCLLGRRDDAASGSSAGPWAGAAFLAVSPMLWNCCGGIGSDAPGLLLGLSAFALLSRGRRAAAGVCLGALAGVRASYLFFWVPALVAGGAGGGRPGGRGRLLAGGAAGAVLAAAALWGLDCGGKIVEPSVSFLAGHLTRWGSPFAGGGGVAGALERIAVGVFDAFSVGGPVPAAGLAYPAALAALCGVLLKQTSGRERRFWAAYVAAWAAWTFTAQNPASLRHYLPLELAAAASLDRLRERARGKAALAAMRAGFAACAVLFALVARRAAGAPTPEYAIATLLHRSYPQGEGLLYFGGDSCRVVRYHLPRALTIPVRDAGQARRFLLGEWDSARDPWISGEAAGGVPGHGARKVCEASGMRGLSERRIALFRLDGGPSDKECRR